MTKAQIREIMKGRREKLSLEERKKMNDLIQEQLFQTEIYRQSNQLLSYVSFQAEANTRTIISKARFDGKKVFVPRVEGKNMNFYQISNFEDLVPSKFGVPEPIPNPDLLFHLKELENSKVLILVPGLAFDTNGNRIGYGAGYYDRYLALDTKNNFIKIALAYEFQILESIVYEEYDIPVDYIITPKQMIQCH